MERRFSKKNLRISKSTPYSGGSRKKTEGTLPKSKSTISFLPPEIVGRGTQCIRVSFPPLERECNCSYLCIVSHLFSMQFKLLYILNCEALKIFKGTFLKHKPHLKTWDLSMGLTILICFSFLYIQIYTNKYVQYLKITLPPYTLRKLSLSQIWLCFTTWLKSLYFNMFSLKAM